MVFIIAYVCLGIVVILGIFAECSRVFSCLTWIVAGVAALAVCGAAAMSTAMAAVVVGAVEATAKWYGVTASINTSFLALVWLAAACSIAAAFFWLFTICCCPPDHHRSSRRGRTRHLDDPSAEKLVPLGSYQPLHEPEGQQTGFVQNTGYPAYGGGYAQQYTPHYQSPAPRSDLAYEPYSHANV